MNKKLFLVIVLIMMCQRTAAQKIKFSGEAARSLFICDTEGELDCWFALGKNFCEMETEKPLGILESRIIISGQAAVVIDKITRDCSDGGLFNPYYYGQQGIGCYYDRKIGNYCVLGIEGIGLYKEEVVEGKSKLKRVLSNKSKQVNVAKISEKRLLKKTIVCPKIESLP